MMINRINPNILNDTLNLVQLAQETARQKGADTQVKKLDPVLEQLKSLAVRERENAPANPVGILAQDDFRTLLAVSQTSRPAQQSGSLADRSVAVRALAAGGMADVDIARQFSITRDEVRMIVNLANMGSR